jgi:hypothetical protein
MEGLRKPYLKYRKKCLKVTDLKGVMYNNRVVSCRKICLVTFSLLYFFYCYVPYNGAGGGCCHILVINHCVNFVWIWHVWCIHCYFLTRPILRCIHISLGWKIKLKVEWTSHRMHAWWWSRWSWVSQSSLIIHLHVYPPSGFNLNCLSLSWLHNQTASSSMNWTIFDSHQVTHITHLPNF